jgi:hypothetical protein
MRSLEYGRDFRRLLDILWRHANDTGEAYPPIGAPAFALWDGWGLIPLGPYAPMPPWPYASMTLCQYHSAGGLKGRRRRGGEGPSGESLPRTGIPLGTDLANSPDKEGKQAAWLILASTQRF